MIHDFLMGLRAFFETVFLIVFVCEANFILEEYLLYRFEFRKGFKKRLLTHIHFFFRKQDQPFNIIATALTLLPFVWATALLPGLHSIPFIQFDQSIIVYFFVMTTLPSIYFFIDRLNPSGFSDRTKERAMVTLTLMLLLCLNLFIVTGETNILRIQGTQAASHWLIFNKPITIFIFIGMLVTSYYVTQQNLFASTQEIKNGFGQMGPLHVWKASWLLFLVSTFCGGGGVSIVPKAILLNFIATLFMASFSRLKEDQTEELILWEAAPVALFLLLITLVFIGGNT